MKLMYSFFAICVIVLYHSINGYCNQRICGSVVSKCLLTKSCQCTFSDCYCCSSCLICMGTLFTECCGCLDMCPRHNETVSALVVKSQIGDFEGVPELFESVTDVENDDWFTVRFPMADSLPFQYNTTEGLFAVIDDKHTFKNKKLPITANCTVIFLNNCMTTTRCLKHCESMGAKSYRWFHDGCCECVGANCFNYGINESRCSSCPEEQESDTEETAEDEMSWDSSGDDTNYNRD